MNYSSEFLIWLDGRLKDFNNHLLLADRELRYRQALPDYEEWVASIPVHRRNVLCGGACIAFARELLWTPRAWALLASLKFAVVNTSSIEPEVAWQEYSFPFDHSVVGNSVEWKKQAFKKDRLVSDGHVFLTNSHLTICPTTGVLILYGLRQILEEPKRIQCFYEDSVLVKNWVRQSIQWTVSPAIGLPLLPGSYRDATISVWRPAILVVIQAAVGAVRL